MKQYLCLRDYYIVIVIALFLGLFFVVPVYTQSFKADLSVDNTTLLSSQYNPPIWLSANSWGIFENDDIQTIAGLRGNVSLNSDSVFSLSSTLSVALAQRDKTSPLIREAYVEASAYELLLKGGIFRHTVGELPNEELSSGSLAVSSNARPMPRIMLLTDDFIDVPFTSGYLQTNFGYSHGWFTDKRYVENTLLHEKWLYFSTQKEDSYRLHFGLVHEAMWGGDNGSIPFSLENYLRVVFNRSGGEDAASIDSFKAGNSLGIWDAGISLYYSALDIHGYYHHLFEDRSGLSFRNGPDGLWGVAVDLKTHRNPWPKCIVYELLTTKYQTGKYHDLGEFGYPEVILSGSDRYYSHGVYASGWTHYGRIIGTPFFIVRGEGEDARVVSNRVNAKHISLSGNLHTHLKYRLSFSYVIHANAYSSPSLVEEGNKLHNFHSFVEFEYTDAFSLEPLELGIGIGYDILETNKDTFGMSITAKWNVF